MSLELSGPEVSRSSIEAAEPKHPSLLDPTHQMDSLFEPFSTQSRIAAT